MTAFDVQQVSCLILPNVGITGVNPFWILYGVCVMAFNSKVLAFSVGSRDWTQFVRLVTCKRVYLLSHQYRSSTCNSYT